MDLAAAAGILCDELIDFHIPGYTLYNPLEYARAPYNEYCRRYGSGRKNVVFFGMNPGPWGMAQTGIPFGEINTVRDWLQIAGHVGKPDKVHPKRPVQGFAVTRSEVSGRRLWDLVRKRFGDPPSFFKDHFVANYCPLLFFDESGSNITPDKLPPEYRGRLFGICDDHALRAAQSCRPGWLVGIGNFVRGRLESLRDRLDAAGMTGCRIESILHPSPASPAANRGWAVSAAEKLIALGIWKR